ncbi:MULTISPECIES: hypothetical protein [Enterococcus]|uniref:hypothetical protein n=1 Tax=Enterococcus TaxID=1350 RepID=UPI001E5A0A4F|nr:hypothetical protein [Enterococcus mundtii]MDV7743869.1 hypothetical protein [Enterococcus mundtii]
MDQNRKISKFVYRIENGLVKIGKLVKGTQFIVIDTIDTNKDKIGNESKPKKNSMQAMVVAKIKEEYLGYNEQQLRKVPGFPDSVITKNLTITYAGTTSVKDWHTNFVEI